MNTPTRTIARTLIVLVMAAGLTATAQLDNPQPTTLTSNQ